MTTKQTKSTVLGWGDGSMDKCKRCVNTGIWIYHRLKKSDVNVCTSNRSTVGVQEQEDC